MSSRPIAAGLCLLGLACGPPPNPTASGGYEDSRELLRAVFRLLPSAGPDELTQLAGHARRTPGVVDAGRYENPDGMVLRFAPPVDGEELAFIAGWDDVFVLPGPSAADPYVLSLFQRTRDYSGSYQQVSFAIPKAGAWRLFAEVEEPPSGPFPKWGTGATGAYPLVDYPVRVNSLTVIDKRQP